MSTPNTQHRWHWFCGSCGCNASASFRRTYEHMQLMDCSTETCKPLQCKKARVSLTTELLPCSKSHLSQDNFHPIQRDPGVRYICQRSAGNREDLKLLRFAVDGASHRYETLGHGYSLQFREFRDQDVVTVFNNQDVLPKSPGLSPCRVRVQCQ